MVHDVVNAGVQEGPRFVEIGRLWWHFGEIIDGGHGGRK
jgi:hypothetical protein